MPDATLWYNRALFDSARVTGLAPGTYTLRATVRSSGDQREAYLALTGCGGAPCQRVALPRTGPRDWVQVALSTRVTGPARTITVHPADPTSGNGWENQALFDYQARAQPAMTEFTAAGGRG